MSLSRDVSSDVSKDVSRDVSGQLGIAGTGLLDLYPALVGYSLRSLTDGFGDVALVRRTVGSPTEEGFTAGEIDDGTMLSWVTESSGTADGHVVTMYNQGTEGAGNPDATQATELDQPQLVISGTTQTVTGGKPAPDYDGVNHFLQTAVLTSRAQPITIACVFQHQASADDYVYDSISADMHLISRRASVNTFRLNAGLNVNGGTADANLHLLTALFNGTGFQFWVDGASAATGICGSNAWDGITIGATDAGAGVFDGKIAELVVWRGNKSGIRTAFEANIAAYYGITLS